MTRDEKAERASEAARKANVTRGPEGRREAARKAHVTQKAGKLVAALNGDLAGEYQAIIMYVTYAAAVTGPHRPVLKQFFAAEIPEELAHAQFLAEKIASLGGTPTTEPRPVPAAADAQAMLRNVLEAERQAIADYKQRAEQAAAFGDKGLATHLETIVEDETAHFEETEKILRGW